MKKFVLLVAILISNVAFADYYKTTVNSCDGEKMRAALDRATAEHRAVITIIECDNGIVRTIEKPAYDVKPVKTCGCGCETKQEVVKREYFVRETVQTYKPDVTYVPAGTYTRVKPACKHDCF